MPYHDEWVEPELFYDCGEDGLVDLVVLATRFGRVAVDAAWFDKHIASNADWRPQWQRLLEQLGNLALSEVSPTTLILIEPEESEL